MYKHDLFSSNTGTSPFELFGLIKYAELRNYSAS